MRKAFRFATRRILRGALRCHARRVGRNDQRQRQGCLGQAAGRRARFAAGRVGQADRTANNRR